MNIIKSEKSPLLVINKTYKLVNIYMNNDLYTKKKKNKNKKSPHINNKIIEEHIEELPKECVQEVANDTIEEVAKDILEEVVSKDIVEVEDLQPTHNLLEESSEELSLVEELQKEVIEPSPIVNKYIIPPEKFNLLEALHSFQKRKNRVTLITKNIIKVNNKNIY